MAPVEGSISGADPRQLFVLSKVVCAAVRLCGCAPVRQCYTKGSDSREKFPTEALGTRREGQPKRMSRMTGIGGLPWASTDSRNGR